MPHCCKKVNNIIVFQFKILILAKPKKKITIDFFFAKFMCRHLLIRISDRKNIEDISFEIEEPKTTVQPLKCFSIWTKTCDFHS
jgi:hypothetical protein